MIKLDLILNILIALFLYNVIIKSIGASIIKEALKAKSGEKAKEDIKKSFGDRIKDLKAEKDKV